MSKKISCENQAYKDKMRAISIAEQVATTIEADKTKVGILLCEGLEESIDVALYSLVYPHLVVIPSNGCTDIAKMLPRVKKYSEYPAFGIIDRDSMSKRKIEQMMKRDIYVTKLPFIENIICCPEVLKLICREYELNYQEVIRKIRKNLTTILAEKLMNLNPFNVDLPREQEITHVVITIVTKSCTVNKKIDLQNVMYTFRDKMIVSEVAEALGFHGKEWYYKFIVKELHGKLKDELTFIMSKYLPKIEVTDV